MYKFSPSQIGLLEECPRCFWLLHNRNIKRPEGIFPSLPSGMDRILKVHFDEYTKKGELPPELKDQKELKDVRLFSDLELLNKWRSNYHGIKLETGKYVLKGAIDALLQKGKKLILLDYKTRGYPVKEDTHEHYIGQQTLYNFIFRRMGYDTEDYSYLLFYHPDKVVENVFVFHKDLVRIKIDVESAERMLDSAVKLLEGPIPKAGPECEYCKYREIKIDKESSKETKKSLLDY